MMAHTLGNPFDLDAVLEFCERHDLWLIEDNCDALGSTYTRRRGKTQTRLTGTLGDLSTQSFYPPHHLTLGEGGAVNIVTRTCASRSWSRVSATGAATAGAPAARKTPAANDSTGSSANCREGYDHKYIYSHIGYNLKPLDPQAAIGRQQLKKLPEFMASAPTELAISSARDWPIVRGILRVLSCPTHATGWKVGDFAWDKTGSRTDPSWFGFMLLVKPGAPFSRTEIALALDQARIGNRMLFGGNLIRQPAFVQLQKDRPGAFRVMGDLPGADQLMNEAIFVGVYPGLSTEMLDYVIETIHKFARAK